MIFHTDDVCTLRTGHVERLLRKTVRLSRVHLVCVDCELRRWDQRETTASLQSLFLIACNALPSLRRSKMKSILLLSLISGLILCNNVYSTVYI